MAAARRRWAAELLHFWFHSLRPADWFRSSEAVDSELRRRFARDLAMLRTRPAHEFLSDPRTALAAVLLFDQVPRNLFRGRPQAFATDPLARQIRRAIVAKGWDRGLSNAERQFLSMPLMHSEAIADQLASLGGEVPMKRSRSRQRAGSASSATATSAIAVLVNSENSGVTWSM